MKLAALGAGVFPSTLAGRVLFIIFAGLIVAHLAAFALFEMERTQAVERYAAADAAGRISEYARLPTEFAVAPSRSAPRARIRWQVVAALENPPQGETRPSIVFEKELRRLLKQSLGADPVAWMSMREVKEGSASEPEGSRKFVTVALNLPDGRHAVAESMLFEPSLRIPAEAWLSIGLLFVLTANFSIWAVNLAMKPVRLLAGAAERLSRNIDEPPLAEEGADEIRSAARSFNRMQDRLRRHVNSRAIAFAAMSHDLRTPLTRMRLRLESLDENARRKLEGDLAEIETLATSALDATRGLATDEPLTRVDLDALATRLREDFAQMGRELRVEGGAAPIEARPLLLRRALVNTIDNAFKYASHVALRIEDSPHEVKLHVLDRGPGIPPDELEKVLYPFYRVESSRNRETGGAGLGLAIAKDIAEGHGGTLELANRPDGGLRVTLVLPR